MSESSLSSPSTLSPSPVPWHIGVVDEDHSRLLYDVQERLSRYGQIEARDNTATILETFTAILPIEGARNIHADIMDCPSDEDLRKLSTHLLSEVLIPFKSRGGHTPIPVTSPSSTTGDVEELSAQIRPSVREQERVKREALERDGGKCVFSGYYDKDSAPPACSRTARTQACHILPSHLGSFGSIDSLRNRAATKWDAIYHCFPSLRDHIGPDNTNDLSNVITMIDFLQAPFGEFEFSLRATNTVNKYSVIKYDDLADIYNSYLPESGEMTFRNHSATLHPLPNPKLVAAHHAVAEILHMEGCEKDSTRAEENQVSS